MIFALIVALLKFDHRRVSDCRRSGRNFLEDSPRPRCRPYFLVGVRDFSDKTMVVGGVGGGG